MVSNPNIALSFLMASSQGAPVLRDYSSSSSPPLDPPFTVPNGVKDDSLQRRPSKAAFRPPNSTAGIVISRKAKGKCDQRKTPSRTSMETAGGGVLAGHWPSRRIE